MRLEVVFKGAWPGNSEKLEEVIQRAHLVLILFYSDWRVTVRDPHDCMPKHGSLTDEIEISLNGKISKNRLK